MAADHSVYRSERLAESYARSRPPVHGAICDRILGPPFSKPRVERALDAGCGAGASTAALIPYASSVIGVDPYREMLDRAETKVAAAKFVQGRLESLPFEAAFFQLVATAGAINYADVPVALAEVYRVLEPGGWLAAYDFSAGRRLIVDSPLPRLYGQFRQRYPSSPGYELDLRSLPLTAAGLALINGQEFSVDAAMSVEDYVRYLLGDAGVESAIVARATTEGEVHEFCMHLFDPVFGGQTQRVAFEVQAILARKPHRGSSQ